MNDIMNKLFTETPAQRAHRWGRELSKLPDQQAHQEFAKILMTLMDDGVTEISIRTLQTLLEYAIPINPAKLGDAFDKFHECYGDLVLDASSAQHSNSEASKLLATVYPKDVK